MMTIPNELFSYMMGSLPCCVLFFGLTRIRMNEGGGSKGIRIRLSNFPEDQTIKTKVDGTFNGILKGYSSNLMFSKNLLATKCTFFFRYSISYLLQLTFSWMMSLPYIILLTMLKKKKTKQKEKRKKKKKPTSKLFL